MQHQDFKGVTDKGREQWKLQKAEKLLSLKQLESKSFHLAREVKHRAR